MTFSSGGWIIFPNNLQRTWRHVRCKGMNNIGSIPSPSSANGLSKRPEQTKRTDGFVGKNHFTTTSFGTSEIMTIIWNISTKTL